MDPSFQNQQPPAPNLVHQRNWTDYLWIIREHWILALLVAAVASGAFAFKKLQEVPLYKSVAILIFDPKNDQVINIQSVVNDVSARSAEFILRNHLTDLRSNSFRERIVETLTPGERTLLTKDYADPESDEEPNIQAIIAGANKIALIGGNIFKFEFDHRDPQAAALLANRFSEEFLDMLLERSRRTNEAALRFLRSQSEELKLKVERSELAVQQYRQERNLVSLEESQNLVVERMKNISSALNSAKLERLGLSASLKQIEESGGDFDQLSALPVINQMGSLPQKFEQRRTLLASRNTMALRYGKRHPRMVENAAELETVESYIRDAIDKNVSDFRQQYATVDSRVKSLEEELAKAEKDSLELDQIAIEYNVLRRKLETDERLFSQVHTRLNEAILASQLTETNLRLVDRAWPAGMPFSPDETKIYGMSVFLFLALFVGIPFGIHYLNLNLKTAADIEEQLRIPFIGEIRKFPRKARDLHRLVLDQTLPEGVELFRQIHSQILLKVKTLQRGHTFIVTSAVPKEGKSFFAINLAASFARHHYKTLLVDCDFRRPSIGPRMKEIYERDSGERVEEGQAIVVNENLDILPVNKGTIEATELIESKGFKEAIAHWQSGYDIVIIDTPPAGIFPDAALIGNYAHHFIFLTLLNKHRKGQLKAILNRLDQSKAGILGLVVNRVSRGKSRNLGAYRYADYRKYKNYYPEKVTAK